ncbi:MAG: DUF3887 domain-containing protein [Lawsonibacter sp.]|nr:DUF3887 domain-containing protein [Lawsonibacter sp.]
MRRLRHWLPLLALTLLLTGCNLGGHPLPEGMEEKTVLEQGREVVALLNAGDWQGVYDRLRPASQETTTPEAIQTYMEERLDKAGAYSRETDALVTGQTLEDTGEKYGTAVLYCKHAKKSAVYRIAFSAGMELMGIEVTVR